MQVQRLMASRVGRIENVLTERNGIGRTEQFLPVAMPGSEPGKLLAVHITGVAADGLVGETVREAA